MLNRSTCVAALILASAIGSAKAHFLFYIPSADGSRVQVIFSETLKPDDVVEASMIEKTKTTAMMWGGRRAEITLEAKTKHEYAAALPPGTRMVSGELDLGFTQRGEGKPHRLIYHSKAIVSGDFADAPKLKSVVELVPQGGDGHVQFLLLGDGNPIADAEVAVLNPDGIEERVKTDASGLTPEFKQRGQFGAWARYWKDLPGEIDSKKYDQERHYAMVVFNSSATAADAGEAPRPTNLPAAQRTHTLPQAVSSFGAVMLDGSLYVYGGHTAPTHDYDVNAVSGKFYRLAVEGDESKWETLPGGPTVQGMNLASDGRRVYRVGGMKPMNQPGEPVDNWSISDAAAFDPKAGEWEPLAKLPQPRSSHEVAFIGDTLYVIGGWDMKGDEGNTWLDSFLTMDLGVGNPKWTSHPQPFKRRALICGVHNDKLYVIGGFKEDNTPTKQVDIYDPAKDVWTSGPELPGNVRNGFSAAACVLNDVLYVSVADGTLLKLDDASSTWIPVATATPRIVHRLAAHGDYIYIIGGANKGDNIDLVERVKVK